MDWLKARDVWPEDCSGRDIAAFLIRSDKDPIREYSFDGETLTVFYPNDADLCLIKPPCCQAWRTGSLCQKPKASIAAG